MNKMEWSHYQEAIFAEVENGTGHLVVEALAGSGKTATAVELINRIPRKERILFTAFNKAIAEELSRRIQNARCDILTLHALGLKAVARYRFTASRNVNAKRIWPWIEELLGTRYEPGTADAFLAERLGDHNLPHRAARVEYETRAALKQLVSLSKNMLASTPQASAEIAADFDLDPYPYSPLELGHMAQHLMDRAAEDETEIDFDDMVWLPAACDMTPPQYDVVVVDELQDMNPCQLWLARRALKKGGRFIGVGDRRQCIYAWRGADTQGMDRIVSELDAKVLPLSITYRCPRAVVRLAQKVVPQLEPAPDAPEGYLVESADPSNAQPSDFVISRTNAALIKPCLALVRRRIPARIRNPDLGASLARLVKHSGTHTIPDLKLWLDHHQAEESIGMSERTVRELADRMNTIRALTHDAPTPGAVATEIERLFSNDTDGHVAFGTVHRMKGLEAERVYLICSTFVPRWETEELNIWYVAVTRSKSRLYLCGAAPPTTQADFNTRCDENGRRVR